MKHGGYGCKGIGSCQDQTYQLANGSRYCVEGCTFLCNNFSAGFLYIFQHGFFIQRFHILAVSFHFFIILICAETGNVSACPWNEGGVAVLAKHISVDISLGYFEVLGKSIAKSCCIKNSSGSHNLILRKTGNLGKYIGHNVYRVAYNNILCVRSFFYDLRSDALQNIYVCLSKLNSGLSRFAGDSGCDDHNVGIFGICVISGYQRYRASEAGSLLNVHNLAFYLFLVDVDQNNLGSDLIVCQCVSDSGANASSSDNGNFAAHKKLLSWGCGIVSTFPSVLLLFRGIGWFSLCDVLCFLFIF